MVRGSYQRAAPSWAGGVGSAGWGWRVRPLWQTLDFYGGWGRWRESGFAVARSEGKFALWKQYLDVLGRGKYRYIAEDRCVAGG